MYAEENVIKFVNDHEDEVGIMAGEILRRAKEVSTRGVFHGGVLRSVMSTTSLRNQFLSVVANDAVHQRILVKAIVLSKIPAYDEIQDFVIAIFSQVVTPSTPCHMAFHVDINGINTFIASPIHEKLELDGCSIADLYFEAVLGDQKEVFFEKYPSTLLSTHDFTIAKFCEMIHDLFLIKNGQQITP